MRTINVSLSLSLSHQPGGRQVWSHALCHRASECIRCAYVAETRGRLALDTFVSSCELEPSFHRQGFGPWRWVLANGDVVVVLQVYEDRGIIFDIDSSVTHVLHSSLAIEIAKAMYLYFYACCNLWGFFVCFCLLFCLFGLFCCW